ncbi:hypothetical protein BOX15_Mlig034046g3, partial [Macrostomum lignano]
TPTFFVPFVFYRLLNASAMATKYSVIIFICLVNMLEMQVNAQSTIVVVPYANPSCTTGKYFDSTRLACRDCGANQTTSADGLSCVCRSGFRITSNYGGNIACEICSGSTVPSKDGWSCVTCPASNPKDATTGYCSACPYPLNATAEYQINGVAYSTVTCVACTSSTFVAPDGAHCIPCPNVLKMKSAINSGLPTPTCDCTGTISSSTGATYTLQSNGGICFAVTDSTDVTLPAVRTSGIQTTISKVSSDSTTANSIYLSTHLAAAYGMCASYYSNRTACQVLANACALILYRQTNIGTGNRDACVLFNEYFSTRTEIINSNSDWKAGLPWLYHSNPSSLLTSEGVTTQFTRLSTIAFQAAVYTQNGTFVGYKALTEGLIQLCPNSRNEQNSAYAFGTRYTSSCSLLVDDLFDQAKYPLQFFDIYLKITSDGGTEQLFPVPVKISDLRSQSNNFPNQGSNTNDYILTRRFFLVDNVGAVSTVGSRASFVRYASKIQIDITLLSKDIYSTDGRIYPPVITVEYSDVDSNLYGTSATVSATFNVAYFSDLTTFWEALKITMGVLCGVAALYAIFRSIAYKSRSGGENFEATIILHFIAFACSAIANVFLIVIYGASVWYFSVYKNQNIFAFFIPTEAQEINLIVYIAVAGALKLIEVIYMIITQSHIDIFMIDWEKPKADSSQLGAIGRDEVKSASRTEVTYWRTVLIANEWNEIQTHRKTNRTFTLLVVLFFMSALGFENYASGDPQLSRFVVTDEYRASNVTIFRFCLAMSVFIGVGGIQWLWTLLIHERFIEDKLRNFVDLCSIANISVFIRSPRSFGYYIHGESPHGTADVGVSQLHDQFEKEKQNDCGRRGLDNTDNQTFMMRLPPNFVSVFDNLYRNLLNTGSVAGTDAKTQQVHSIKKYHEMNNFLTRFIHKKPMEESDGAGQGGKPIEGYGVQPRKCMEDVLGMELGGNDTLRDGGIFYSEDGTSFGDVLFYGNELSLMTFDLLVYSCVDLIFKSTPLNVIITWLIGELIDFLRSQLGEINLSKKTMTNRQFLI